MRRGHGNDCSVGPALLCSINYYNDLEIGDVLIVRRSVKQECKLCLHWKNSGGTSNQRHLERPQETGNVAMDPSDRKNMTESYEYS